MLTLVSLGEEYTEALCTNLRILLLVLSLFQIKQKLFLKVELEKKRETHITCSWRKYVNIKKMSSLS